MDPVYCGLVGADLPKDQLARWLLAYWCFYHVGVASFLSEQEGSGYWELMLVAAKNEDGPFNYEAPGDRWPRAAERRHFRGAKCVAAIIWLRAGDVPPEHWVQSLSGHILDKQLMAQVQTWPMFGKWIAFKAADMMERVWGAPVEFDRNIGLLYAEPRAGLELAARKEGVPPTQLYHELLTTFWDWPAPPRGDRRCGPQECETVLCKWKSYMGGHYYLGKDIYEQREALHGWGATAKRIAAAYPKEVARVGC